MGKRILIVGGVAGGMSCAARARRLSEDAEIIVFERGEYVSFANCGLPYYVGGEITDENALLVQTPEKLAAALNLDVRPFHEVISIDAAAKRIRVRAADGTEADHAYDALVLSPGAKVVRPPIDGLDSPLVRTLRAVDDAHALRAQVTGSARRAVVLGAGFIGIEAAEALAHAGLETALVELAPHVLPPLEAELATEITRELSSSLNISVHDGVAAERIEPVSDSSARVHLANGQILDADLIVLSTGVTPDTEFFASAGGKTELGAIVIDEHGRTNLPDVYAAGDAVLSTHRVSGLTRPVPLAGPANRAGRYIADHIFAPELARKIPAPLSTAIVRVGALTAAITGANRRDLEAAGIDYHTIHLHPLDHAGYFPGASAMHLLVHFAPDSGTILGAQAVGKAGVDKRIDVFATAIVAGLAIDELIDLDLCYSPPYGQARDAVNQAAMVGHNILSGKLSLWYADQLEDILSAAASAQAAGEDLSAHPLILDVRSAGEFARCHIPGSLNIAHTELRDRMEELRAAAGDRELYVLCAAGVRSWIGYRAVVGNGFAAKMLSGGMGTLLSTLGERAGEVLSGTDFSK